MRKLNFVILDSQSSWGLEDVINAVYYSYSQLSLALEFSFSNLPKEDCLNFVFEEFTNLTQIELDELVSGKYNLVLIVSEFCTKNGFNRFDKPSLFNYTKGDVSNIKYLNSRYKSFKKILGLVQFTGFLILHGAINNAQFKKLISKLNSATPIHVFHPILPTQKFQISTKRQTDYWKETSTRRFEENHYITNNKDVVRNWVGSGYEHFLRYGIFEKRLTFNLFSSELTFSEKLNFINSSSLNKDVSDVKLSTSGSPQKYRSKWIKTLKQSHVGLSPLGFQFDVELISGWNKFDYSIQSLIDENGTPIFKTQFIDVVISISEHWPYLSPIRIWRSFACGLLPIRIGAVQDLISPLKDVLEQVNSPYPIYSFYWAACNPDYLEVILTKISKYNDRASLENLTLLDLHV